MKSVINEPAMMTFQLVHSHQASLCKYLKLPLTQIAGSVASREARVRVPMCRSLPMQVGSEEGNQIFTNDKGQMSIPLSILKKGCGQ